ncbi:hypothetical protein WJX81_000295 [Elliptochloris bilobata]|uniref:Serine protease n=1 Tax=Elliptochloris bilobata TaxID=381761 RepID=A0AAW1RK77_9CHLO
MPVPGQAETAPVLRVASIVQGLPDTLHRVKAAERRRRLLGSGRRLAQAAPARKVGFCTRSVRCYPEYNQTAAAVIDIYAINLSLGPMALCTGMIINAPMNRTLLVFNYEAPCGAKKTPPIVNVIQGAVLKFYDSHGDVLLLEVPNVIPDQYQVYELGYDASKDAVPKNGFSIHHPAGNIAHVKWGEGATEGGSSGSPLIDADTGKVVGVLTGGFSNCLQPTTPDYYGRLSAAWQGGLDHYLSTDPPADLVTEVAYTLSHYYLSDAPRPGETIRMNMTVNGMEPDNTWDVTPHLAFSATNDSFTAGDSCRRNITVFLTNVDSSKFKAVDMIRFLVIFELTSDINPNYKHIHMLKGIGQHSLGPWTQYQPIG